MHAGSDLDATLIDASRKGDRSAFAQIVERYQRAVYAVSISSVRDRALSDDITQDTFVTAWRRLGDLRDPARLPAWLCGIARNLARDARKRQRREPAGDAQELADTATPFDALSDAESERLVAVALARVPAVYRDALVLFYYEQRSVQEVARVLGISAYTTNKRLSRGRQHLAAGVEALIERKLTTRGPRRDLAACVLAAIGVIGSAAHVDASPLTTTGSSMTKLAIATVVLATVGGVGLLAAGPTTPTKPGARPTTPTSSSAAPLARAATPPVQGTAATGGVARGASRPPALPMTPPSNSARLVPDCETAARHMAELQIDAVDPDHRLPAQKLAQILSIRTRDLARHCTDEAWSEERRICVMDADDSDGARFDCVEGVVATPHELLPPELRCDLVGKHVADLMSAPGGKLALLAKKLGPKFDLGEAVDQMRDGQAAECERIPWSIAVRRCIVTSKTNQEMAHCL